MINRKYESQLGFILADLIKMSNDSDCRLVIEVEDDLLVARVEKKVRKRNNTHIWELLDSYTVNFSMISMPELNRVNSPNLGDIDWVHSGDGSPIINQIYPSPTTFRSQKVRNRPHLYGDDPLGLKRRSCQFPFSRRGSGRRSKVLIPMTQEEKKRIDVLLSVNVSDLYELVPIE